MTEAVTIAVDPQTLIKVRERSGYPDVESVYANMKNPEEQKKQSARLKEFESGTRQPTLKQIRALAEKYFVRERVLIIPHERAIAELPNVDAIHDFRMMGEDYSKPPELIRFLREMLVRQERLNEVLEDEDIPDLGWIGSGKNLTPEQAGAELRSRIWRNDRITTKLKRWIEKVEKHLGVAVMQLRPHHNRAIKQQISGVALPHDRIPAVVLNTKDSEKRRLFTLLHELAHLLIQKPGISKIKPEQDAYITEDVLVEQHCNQIAENALMPKVTVGEIWDEQRSPEDNLKAIARKTGASDSACAVRAYHLGLIDGGEMRGLLTIYNTNYAADASGQSSFRIVQQHIQARERVGYRMTRLSLLAYDEGRISPRDLYYIFGVKLDYLPKIAEQVDYNIIRWHPPSKEWLEQNT